MYPFELYVKVLKGYFRKCNMLESCIVQRYVVEEALEYCTVYLDNLEAIGVPKNRNERSIIDINGHGIGVATVSSVG